jgi:hypothetical protein
VDTEELLSAVTKSENQTLLQKRNNENHIVKWKCLNFILGTILLITGFALGVFSAIYSFPRTNAICIEDKEIKSGPTPESNNMLSSESCSSY